MATNQVDYYREEIIQRKLEEYCSSWPRHFSGSAADDIVRCSSEYWVGYGESLTWDGREEPFASVQKSHEGFNWLMSKGLDFFRAVWDEEVSIFNIDIEYFNLDNPAYAYVNPRRSMMLVETVWKQLLKILDWGYGIKPLVFQTGNGVQMTFAVVRNSHEDILLQTIGCIEGSVESKYRDTHSGVRPWGLPISQGLSFDGIGRIVEMLYHKLVYELRVSGWDFPMHVGDISAIHSTGMREGINFDCSLYFDPLFMRDTRAPFSTHQKHKVYRNKVGEDVANSVPIQIAIPRYVRDWDGNFFEIDFDTVMGRGEYPGDDGIRRHYDAAVNLAYDCNCRIPVYDFEVRNLLEEYFSSVLSVFHNEFDSVYHEPYWKGYTWYSSIDWYSIVPPCVAEPLTNASSDKLLNPAYIQLITRVLMAKGFHPKHIAGILSMKYVAFGGWDKYDQSTRANGWVRSYAGQILCLIDSLDELNCVSVQENGMCNCSGGPCHNLSDYRNDLENIRQNWFHRSNN